MIKSIGMLIMGAGAGLLSAAGVFTVLLAIGLVPRFAGKTHTAKYILLYEEMIVLGAITGCIVSIFPSYCQFAGVLQDAFPQAQVLWQWAGVLGQVVVGTFSGIFVGSLALAIAEMLDSIPIFARRVSLRHGIGIVILSMAIGKICGSLLYLLDGKFEAK